VKSGGAFASTQGKNEGFKTAAEHAAGEVRETCK